MATALILKKYQINLLNYVWNILLKISCWSEKFLDGGA